MLRLSDTLSIPDSEIAVTAVRAGGAGGQNVNKVSSAIHLRFDIRASSLPALLKERLLGLNDQRITGEGVIVIKAQQHRSQDLNREAALERLRELLTGAMVTRRKRVPTRPTRSARAKRVDSKVRRGRIKQLRGRVEE